MSIPTLTNSGFSLINSETGSYTVNLPDSNIGARKTITLAEDVGFPVTIQLHINNVYTTINLTQSNPTINLIFGSTGWILLSNNPEYNNLNLTSSSGIYPIMSLYTSTSAITTELEPSHLALLSNQYGNNFVSVSGNGNTVACSYYFGYQVYITTYTYNTASTTYIYSGSIVPPNMNPGTATTYPLILSLSNTGTLLAVGGPNDTNDQGTIWLFQYVNSWVFLQQVSPGVASANFGASVSLSPDGYYLAVGSPGNGAVYVYSVSTTLTQLGTTIQPSVTNFGTVVQMINSVTNGIIVLASSPTTYSVYSYVYTTSWSTFAPTVTYNSGSGFGTSFSASTDASVLAVGAPTSEVVLTYTLVSGSYTNQRTISSVLANGSFGTWISLSGDGSTLAVGTPNFSGQQTNVGAVSIFSYIPPVLPMILGTWVEYITTFGANTNGYYGYNLALANYSNTLIVVSNQPTITQGGQYFQAYTITPNTINVNFGTVNSCSITPNGQYAIVGSPNTNGNTGSINIYNYEPGSSTVPGFWAESSSIPTISTANALFGYAVWIQIINSTQNVFVGYPGTNGVNQYVFSGGSYNLQNAFQAASGTFYGQSLIVDPNGTTLVIGQNGGAEYRTLSTPATRKSLTVPSGSSGFGYSVAIASSLNIVIGAPNTSSNNGAAYLYPAGQTSSFVTINAPDTDGQFGISVAIATITVNSVNVDIIAIGEPYFGSGVVYTYAYSSGTVTSLDTIPAPGDMLLFGLNVSITVMNNVPYLAVGAPGAQTTAVWIYQLLITGTSLTGAQWTLYCQSITPQDNSLSFGYGLQLVNTGTNIILAAIEANGQTGNVATFELSSVPLWTGPTADYEYTNSGAYLGQSVCTGNNLVFAGAPNDENGLGSVNVFEYTLNTLNLLYNIPSIGSAGFGTQIACSEDGTILAVISSTQILAYHFAGGLWEDVSTGLSLTNTPPTSVSISSVGTLNGTVLVVGISSASEFQGWVYSSSSSSWAPTNTVTFPPDTQFGISVSLSSNGLTLAVGAPGSSGGNGVVSILILTGTTWSSSVSIAPSGVTSFGFQVSLSADGTTFSAAANSNPSNLPTSQVNPPSTPPPAPNPAVIQTGNNNGKTGTRPEKSPRLFQPETIHVTKSSLRTLAAPTNNILSKSIVPQKKAPIRLTRSGIIGTPLIMLSSGTRGEVLTFQNNSGWVQIGSVQSPNTSDNFGSQISLVYSSTGTKTMAVGAPGTNTVYIYSYISSNWILQTSFNYPVNTSQFGLGLSLNSSGNVVYVGAPQDFNQNIINTGSIFAFQNGLANVESYAANTLTSSVEGNFGTSTSLSLDGSYLAVGAPSMGIGYASSYLYQYGNYNSNFSSGILTRDGPILITPNISNNTFGQAISISSDGSTLVVGAPNDLSSGPTQGQVVIYSTANLSGSPTIINGPAVAGQSFGYSVSVSGDGSLVAIGAPFIYGGSTATPIVVIYNTSSATQTVINPPGGPGSTFGNSVSLSVDGSTLAVGDELYNNSLGTVYIYLASNNWSTYTQINYPGTSANVNFGYSVALSSNGSKLLVGAPNDLSGIGNAYLYELQTLTYLILPNQVTTNAYNFGNSVDISQNGQVCVVAAPNNSSTNSNVWIFRYPFTSGFRVNLSGNITTASVSGDGNVIAVGSPDGNHLQGAVYYNYYYLNNLVGFSSSSLATSYGGNTIAVGFPQQNNTGLVSIYSCSNTGVLTQGPDLTQSVFGSGEGYAVAVSQDGTQIASGAPFEGNGVINVYIDQTISDTLPFPGSGTTSMGYNFGSSVAFSPDGTLLAGGAPGYKTTGAVVVYNLTTLTSTLIVDTLNSPISQQGQSVALTNNGSTLVYTSLQYVVSGTQEGPAFWVYNLDTSSFIARVSIGGYNPQIYTMNLAVAGADVVIGYNTNVLIYQGGSYDLTQTISQISPIQSLSLSSDSTQLIVGVPFNDLGEIIIYTLVTPNPTIQYSTTSSQTLGFYGILVNIAPNGSKYFVVDTFNQNLNVYLKGPTS